MSDTGTIIESMDGNLHHIGVVDTADGKRIRFAHQDGTFDDLTPEQAGDFVEQIKSEMADFLAKHGRQPAFVRILGRRP
ncbi:hypothetical protein GS982_20400 [Rhodococcus hoagii]|nr:hypothetical protein [Prescottella equi]NKZ84556.1 hypothetical protein [Prescottella equi]